jgi:hypothetical protein
MWCIWDVLESNLEFKIFWQNYSNVDIGGSGVWMRGLMSSLFELTLNTSFGRILETFFFFSWAGDLFFDFEDKNFAKLGTSLLGGGGNLNCMCSFKRRFL